MWLVGVTNPDIPEDVTNDIQHRAYVKEQVPATPQIDYWLQVATAPMLQSSIWLSGSSGSFCSAVHI